MKSKLIITTIFTCVIILLSKDPISKLIEKSYQRKHMWISHILPLPYNQIFYDYTYRKNRSTIWGCGENLTNCEKFVINYNKHNSKINSILDIGSYQGNSLKRYGQYFQKLNQSVDLFGIDISDHLIQHAKQNTSDYRVDYELFNSSEFLINKYPKTIPRIDVMVFSDILYYFSTKTIPSMGGKLWDILSSKCKDNFIKHLKNNTNKLIVFSNHQNNSSIIKLLKSYCKYDNYYNVYYIDLQEK